MEVGLGVGGGGADADEGHGLARVVDVAVECLELAVGVIVELLEDDGGATRELASVEGVGHVDGAAGRGGVEGCGGGHGVAGRVLQGGAIGCHQGASDGVLVAQLDVLVGDGVDDGHAGERLGGMLARGLLGCGGVEHDRDLAEGCKSRSVSVGGMDHFAVLIQGEHDRHDLVVVQVAHGRLCLLHGDGAYGEAVVACRGSKQSIAGNLVIFVKRNVSVFISLEDPLAVGDCGRRILAGAVIADGVLGARQAVLAVNGDGSAGLRINLLDQEADRVEGDLVGGLENRGARLLDGTDFDRVNHGVELVALGRLHLADVPSLIGLQVRDRFGRPAVFAHREGCSAVSVGLRIGSIPVQRVLGAGNGRQVGDVDAARGVGGLVDSQGTLGVDVEAAHVLADASRNLVPMSGGILGVDRDVVGALRFVPLRPVAVITVGGSGKADILAVAGVFNAADCDGEDIVLHAPVAELDIGAARVVIPVCRAERGQLGLNREQGKAGVAANAVQVIGHAVALGDESIEFGSGDPAALDLDELVALGVVLDGQALVVDEGDVGLNALGQEGFAGSGARVSAVGERAALLKVGAGGGLIYGCGGCRVRVLTNNSRGVLRLGGGNGLVLVYRGLLVLLRGGSVGCGCGLVLGRGVDGGRGDLDDGLLALVGYGRVGERGGRDKTDHQR